MRTDPLIDRLTHDLKPVRRRTTLTDAGILAGLGGIELGLFLAMGFSRSDMPMAMHLPSFWWKLASLGLIALVSGIVAVVSFDPMNSPRRGLRWIIALIAACLSIGWILDASRDGAAMLLMRLDWQDGVQCLYKMVGLSVPAVITLGLLMHRGAPTDRDGTALAAGLAAAAWGAFVFVFACPVDDPLYVAVWYSLGCGAVTLLARLALPPLTRW
ncbi:membrane protein [Aliidongia dinghuensis]|uniref:Membrane protein n=1 Tax=Aliidongia dinghuensis TaxID=1867774 RepID=A0A8J2YYS6_9PROT|nr:NrsF family protein [Aliidongia dinghuensis]GGF42639.1 membrane protein [Aliidongia dinghuensis]